MYLWLQNVYLLCCNQDEQNFSSHRHHYLCFSPPPPSVPSLFALLLVGLQNRAGGWLGWRGSQVCHSRGGGSTRLLVLKRKTQIKHQNPQQGRGRSTERHSSVELSPHGTGADRHWSLIWQYLSDSRLKVTILLPSLSFLSSPLLLEFRSFWIWNGDRHICCFSIERRSTVKPVTGKQFRVPNAAEALSEEGIQKIQIAS